MPNESERVRGTHRLDSAQEDKSGHQRNERERARDAYGLDGSKSGHQKK